MMRFLPLLAAAAGTVLCAWLALRAPWLWWLAAPAAAVTLVGVFDLVQTRHALRRNFPLAARLRWFFEWLRPFLRGYIVESETEGRPFNIEERALVYRRAKNVASVEPFGSHLDPDRPPYDWLAHSIAAEAADPAGFRVSVGGPACCQPYSASVLNISAMSFGALGAAAITALNRGAAKGGFYHDTGEGGISRHHRNGGDLVYEIGTGYFGCRAQDGGFDSGAFRDLAADPQVKMVEIKISQGAKPGHGGVLPGSKVTPEIAEARGIAVGQTCESPASHRAFRTPLEMCAFIDTLRELSGGKPVGFKLCIGRRHEFLAIIKAMLETGVKPDFIVIDGAEGGTGAAPAEFLDHVGMPLREGLAFARNALVGAGLRQDIRLAASGKLVSAYSMASAMALGADWCNTARGFMFALGCIQSLHCHTNRCPTGIATQDRGLQRGLDPADKSERVANFHRNTLRALADLVGAAGCRHPGELTPAHILHRTESFRAVPGDVAFGQLAPGSLLADAAATPLALEWAMARADSFQPAAC